MTDWQPMSGAPRDGQWIIACPKKKRCIPPAVLVCFDIEIQDEFSWATEDMRLFKEKDLIGWMPIPRRPDAAPASPNAPDAGGAA